MAKIDLLSYEFSSGHAMSSYKGKNFKYFVNTGAGCNRHGYQSRSGSISVHDVSRNLTVSERQRQRYKEFVKICSSEPAVMLSDGMFYIGVTMLVYNDPDPVLQKFQNENLSLVDIATSSGKVCFYYTPPRRETVPSDGRSSASGGVLGSSRRRPGRRRPPHAKLRWVHHMFPYEP
jgi:hypothetical protein